VIEIFLSVEFVFVCLEYRCSETLRDARLSPPTGMPKGVWNNGIAGCRLKPSRPKVSRFLKLWFKVDFIPPFDQSLWTGEF
jgi:hypothetical protein